MPDPIIPSFGDNQQSFVKKYREIAPALEQFDKPVRESVYNFDLQRVAQGRQPLTKQETALALLAAQKQRAITKPEDQGIWKRVVGDVRAITSSIPRIPGAMVNEVEALPQAPGAISDALQAGSLGQIVGQLSKAPGLRMVPGAYTVGNIASGNAGELAQHPVFTALDVIPALHSAPVQGLLEAPLARVAERAAPITDALGRTRPGMALKETFGKGARDVARLEQGQTLGLRDALNPEGLPNLDRDVQLARDANRLRREFSDLSDDEVRSVTRIIQEEPGLIPELPDRQLALAFRVKDLQPQFAAARMDEGLLASLDGEVYDSATAKRIMGTRVEAERTRLVASLRDRVGTPAGDIHSLLGEAVEQITKEGLTKKQVKNLAEGYAHAVDAAGYNARPLLRAARQGRLDPAVLADAFRSYADAPIGMPVRATEEVMQMIDPFVRRDSTAARLKQAIKSGDWKAARDTARLIDKRAKFGIPGIDEAVDSLARQAQRQKWLNRNSNFTEKAAAKLEEKAADQMARTPPARFEPMIAKKVQDRYMAMYSTHPDFDSLVPRIMQRNYELLPGFSKGEHAALVDEMKTTWQDMKAAGADPVFVHKVSPGQAAQAQFPRVLESVKSLSQVKERTFDISPSVQDVTVALSHQGMEVLARKASEEMVTKLTGTFNEATGKYVGGWGKTERELFEQYERAAQRAHEIDPSQSVREHAHRLIRKEWDAFNPGDIITWSSPKLSLYSGEGVLLPKDIANTIKRLHTPPAGRLTAVLDPVMKVFRTSLLPLSPRWHLYNIIGGGVMLMGRTDPTVFRFWKQAKAMMEEGTLPRELALGRGMGSVPREAMEWNVRAGGTMRRWWDEIQASKPGMKPGMEVAEGLSKKAGEVIQKSYDINAKFDDMYRVMSYLYGESKGLRKGATAEVATEQGLQLARKVMMDWDGMTPIERSIIRNVFPFYGWMRHVMKYTLTYPWDHPLRASIVGSFARNEIEDMGDGLSYSFLNAVQLGDMDANGNVKQLKFGGMNPFGDFADYFTLAGFTKSLGPVGGTILETLGLDSQSGAPELYPQVAFDPTTGKLAPSGGNPFTKFVTNVIPQSELLLGMVQKKSEFNTLLKSNPVAAGRMITGFAGVPTPYREVNIPTEIAKGELKRFQLQEDVRHEALKTGDWSRAQHFPGLRPFFDQVAVLQGQGKLKEFTPQTDGASLIAAAQRALAGRL